MNVRKLMLLSVLLLSTLASACTSTQNNINQQEADLTLYGKPTVSMVVIKVDDKGRPTADGVVMGRHALKQAQSETRQKGVLNVVPSTIQDHLFEMVTAVNPYVDPDTQQEYTLILRQNEIGTGVGGRGTAGAEIAAGVLGEVGGKALEAASIYGAARAVAGRNNDDGGSGSAAYIDQYTDINVDVRDTTNHKKH